MPRLISLFTGVGGLDLGLEAAGYQVAVTVEMDRDAVATFRANRDWPVVEDGSRPKAIEEISSKDVLRIAGVGIGEIDLVAGGPPCQPFSKAGYWASGSSRRLDDPRAGTLEHFLRIVRDTQPAAYLLENVPGLKFEGKDEGLVYIQRQLEAINEATGSHYSMDVAKLNAADFGVPQFRERVFVIGHREGKTFSFPDPTHAAPTETATSLFTGQPYRTAWDAIGDLEEDDDPALRVTGKWARLLPSIPEGSNYLWHTDRGGGLPLFGWRTRFWTFLLKLAKDRPAWTIQAQPGPAIGPFHWKSRRLSARELCRLQTVPDDYKILGGPRTTQRLLGNAVPSALAELLGTEIRKQFFGDAVSSRLTLVPTRAGSPPAPEAIAEVAEPYRRLIGSHTAHPGTGLGPRALLTKAEGTNRP